MARGGSAPLLALGLPLLGGCGGGELATLAAPIAVEDTAPAPRFEVLALRSRIDGAVLAFDLNNTGAVVGAIGRDAYVWHQDQGLRRLTGAAGAAASAAVGLNDAGWVVGRSEFDSESYGWPTVALVWRPDGSLATSGHALSASEAVTVNAANAAAGIYTDGGWARSFFRWDGSGFVDLGNFGGDAQAIVLGNDGSLVMTVAVEGRHEVHVQRADGDLRLADAYASTVNDSGIIGGCSGGDWHSNVPAIWHADGTMLALDEQNRQGCVEDLNSEGAAVGWYRRADGSVGEFLYQDGRFQDLGSLLGDSYELQAAHAINDGGQILVEVIGGAPLLLTPQL